VQSTARTRMGREQIVKLPTAEQLESAAAAFADDWGGVDEVLYGICRKYPGHAVHREVTAKAALIDRTYAAGLERQVQPAPGDQAMTAIADFLVAHGAEVDEVIATLDAVTEPLDAPAMARIVDGHGRLTTLLSKLTTSHSSPRSFAAKYLHFHRPVVPIYDSYAATRLVKLVRWQADEIPFAPPPSADAEYWSFCVRFMRLYDACRHAGIAVSVKSLDTYLWAVSAS